MCNLNQRERLASGVNLALETAKWQRGSPAGVLRTSSAAVWSLHSRVRLVLEVLPGSSEGSSLQGEITRVARMLS